jgi:hypothetical protein
MGTFKDSNPPIFIVSFALPDGTRVEAEIDFLALDRPEDVRKLRGTQYTFAWLNELKELPKAALDMIQGRIDRFPTPGFSPWVGVIGDTNAWDEDHWLEDLYDEWLNGDLPGYEFFIQPGAVYKCDPETPGAAKSMNDTWWSVNDKAENISVLTHNYYQRQIAGKKDDWIKVNLANEVGIVMDGKAVHADYQESVHRAEKNLVPLLDIPIFVGMDFGLTPAAVFWQQVPTGRWHALYEIAMERGDAVKLADEIKRVAAILRTEAGLMPDNIEGLKFVFRGDPSGDSGADTDSNTVFKILRQNGIPAIPASSNDPTLRRAALDRPLNRMVNGGPGVLVSPRCKVLRKGLAGAFCYRRVQVKGDERFQDKPDKNFWSHVCEAAEYGLMDAGEHAVVDAVAVGRVHNVRPTGAIHPTAPPSAQGQMNIRSAWNPYDV